MRPTQLLATFLAVSSFTAASLWPDQDYGAIQAMHGLFGRADKTSSTEKTSASSTADATASGTDSASGTAQASGTGNSKATKNPSASNTGAATTDGTSSGKASETRTGKSSTGTKKGTKGAASSTIDPRDPAGGVSMMTPAQTTTTFFKIGNNFTFAWNYTSLSVTPKAVDILASCSAKATTYTIAANATVEPTQTVFWDTGPIKEALVMETYTLIIYDAESSISATPQAGYLGVQSTYTFAMYIPEPYTPRAQWKCVACNSAGTLERQAVLSLFAMAALTVISFTWFASGVFGIF